MIFGRPSNLILGAFTALFNVVVLIAQSQGSTVLTPELVAAINLAAASLIAVIANQPPSVKEGDQYTVVTPAGQDNVVKTA